MRKTLSKFFNIYVVIALIGGFSFIYLFSFVFVVQGVGGSSSSQIQKAKVEKKKQRCLEDPDTCDVK